MAFKIGNKTVISNNSIFNVTDTSDSDGGVVSGREGNINFDLSTGSIFKIPYVRTPRLKEKLAMINFPEPGENKMITVVSEARGTPINSPAVGSITLNSSASIIVAGIGEGGLYGYPEVYGNYGPEEYNNEFRFSTKGDYFYWRDNDNGYSYIRRDSLGTNWRAPANDNTYDQNVRYDTNFKSITRYTYVDVPFFDKTGKRIWFVYNGSTIHEFTLSVAWDLTSTKTEIATYALNSYTTDTSPNCSVQGGGWAADGHLLILYDFSGSPTVKVVGLYCSTAYDLSTIYESKNVTPSSYTSGGVSGSHCINYNGDKFYFVKEQYIYEHTLSTPFDLDTLSASYNTYTYTDYPNYPTDYGRIIHLALVDSDQELQAGVFGVGGEDAYVVWDTNRTAASRRSYFIWDSDKISMLNDSAPPMTDSGEIDLFEFLVFDSATGAKQIGFHNQVNV